MIVAINIADGSTLEDNLIKSHQVDYVSKVLIPAVKLLKMTKNTLRLLAIRSVASITPLF